MFVCIAFKMRSCVCLRLGPWNGALPHIISYNTAPNDHQSAALPWPSPVMTCVFMAMYGYGSPVTTSGAMYSTVPQKVVVVRPADICGLANPKSVRHVCPSRCSKIFSGLRSR